MTLKVLPYVYKITNIHTNQFYIGSRSSKLAKHHSEDLGFKYFTSSKTVKELGFENFKIDWIEEFPTKELAYDWEQMMIHVNLKDPLCLNKSCYFGNKKFNFSGLKHSEETRFKISNKAKNRIVSKETRNKMSKSRTGLKRSEETKAKMSNTRKGKKHSEETKLKISKLFKGRTLPKEHIKNLILAKQNITDETKLKMSISAKNKTKIQCIHCNTLFDKANHSKWHGDNCKLKK